MGKDTAAEEFDEFYRATSMRVVHLVHSLTGDLTLAQDATQEAYIKAWRDWHTISRGGNPLGWVRTVARRTAISEWRRRQARGRAHVRHGPPAHAPGPSEDRVLALSALSQLSDPLRETLALHYIADLSVDEISRELDIPPGTVKARLHRGRAKLADALRENRPDGAPGTSQPRPRPRSAGEELSHG